MFVSDHAIMIIFTKKNQFLCFFGAGHLRDVVPHCGHLAAVITSVMVIA